MDGWMLMIVEPPGQETKSMINYLALLSRDVANLLIKKGRFDLKFGFNAHTQKWEDELTPPPGGGKAQYL